MKKRETGKTAYKESVKRNVATTLAFGAAAFLALFALWTIAYFAVENDFLVPSLKDTFVSLGELLTDGAFYLAYKNTLLRVLRAFFVSFFPAALFAVLSYLCKTAQKIAAVFVSALRSLPSMALLLMILVWSTPKKAPVIISFLSLFPMLYTGILNALLSVDEKYKAVCEVFEVPWHKRIFQMYLPQSFPYVLRESAGAASFAVKLVVSAEVVASTFKSVGGLMQEAKIFTDMPRLFALMLLAVLTGLLLETVGNLLAIAAERRCK